MAKHKKTRAAETARARLNRLDERNEKLLRIFKFFIKFILFSVPLYLLLLFKIDWPWLQQTVTNITVALLQAAGYHPSVQDVLVSIPVLNGNWAAVINWDCTGWKSMLAFFALVMATDFPVKRKLAGLILIPVIFAVNLLRIFFMFFYVKTFDLAYYQVVHAIIWSWGLILTIALLWLLWLRYDFTKIRFRKKKTRSARGRR